MLVITLTCPDCGTIVADNVLARNRVVECPGLDCNRELAFSDLTEEDQQYVENYLAKFNEGAN